ncbi:MAG: 4Fe-4S binding protein [Gammaproteobacteria bacterium]|nr:4Fe-4S binding protein [Gammaproteobacteria bacterium]
MKSEQTIRFYDKNSLLKTSGKKLAFWRFVTQYGFILALILIPASGIFRIDLSSGFVVLDRQIWFSDFLIVFGFWLSVACTAILIYSMAGTAFCGWACPHNTFSSLANVFTSQHLGKRAVIDWESTSGKIAKNKNGFKNWFLLISKLILMSMLVSILPLFYFTTPGAVWAFITFQSHDQLSSSLYWIYTVFVFIFLVNFAVVRHFACRYMCVYRMWQFLFRTKDALHITYDNNRSDECLKCNYCVTSCMVDIDPRKTSTFDSCTNCGACITACDSLHEKKGVAGLLKFAVGEHKDRDYSDGTRLMASFRQRVKWVIPVWLFGAGLFVWGMISYQPFQMSVYKADSAHGQQITDYRIHLASKLFSGGELDLSVQGLDSGQFTLSANKVQFQSVGRQDIELFIYDKLKPGVYPVLVKASSASGWEQLYRVQHIVTRK